MKHVLLVIVCAFCANTAWSSDQSTSWRLATDDTVAVIAIRDNVPTLARLGSAKDNSNWLLAPVSETLLSSVSKDGAAVVTNWRYEGGSFENSSGQLVLRFSNVNPAMELRSIWRARPGRGPIEHWVTIANHSGATLTIGHQDSLVLANLVIPADESLDAWSIRRGAGNATSEGGTLVRNVGRNSDETLVSSPTDGASAVPWLALQAGTSRGMYIGWEFSGLGRIRFHSAPATGNPAPITDAGLLAVETGNLPNFKTDLPAGGTFWVPTAFVGCYLGDIDDGSYSLHRFIMEKLLPPFPKGYEFPTLAYNLYLDSGGANADEKGVLASAALAHELGFETFVVDAMWFPQSGAWFWDRRRFPHGYRPIEEYLHGHQMKLGLWMAYTQGSNSTDPRALNIDQHPDWFVATPKLDPEGHINWDALIDLGHDPARDWAEQSTQRVVSEYKLDYFKTDYSPVVTECKQTNHRHHYETDVSYWSALGYYAVQEALLKRFPGLVLEGCSGSGHIKDFGDIQRVHTIAMNDTLSSLPNRQAIYDSSFAFPPAALMDYTYENFYNEVADAPEPYFWRSSMMNQWQIDPTHSSSWTPDQRAKVKRATDIYKLWVRPMLPDAQVHHILPRPDGMHWDGMFYWSPGLRRGTIYIFRPNSEQQSMLVALKGLEPAKRYKLWSEDHSIANATFSGTELMNTGVTIHLPAKFSSDLIYLEETR